jgi:hypothetical protein
MVSPPVPSDVPMCSYLKSLKTFSTPLFLCLLNLSWFAFVGFASPVSVEMFHDFGPEFRFRIWLLSLFHWQWTIPLGIGSSWFILWKNRKLDSAGCRYFNIFALLLLLLFGLAYVLVWKSFIFKM